MTTLQPAAPAANLIFPVDLMSEVPNFAYIEGLRAVWHAPEIAEANVAHVAPRPNWWRLLSLAKWFWLRRRGVDRGVVEITDLRGVVVLDEHVDTVGGARDWLTETVDWHEIVDEEQAATMGDY